MAIPLKDCKQCSHYRGGYCYGFGTAKQVLSTKVALMCTEYTPLGQVQIGPIDSLAGQLENYQLPSGIITTLKLADLAVTSAKLADDSVILSKISNAVITNAKIALAAGIVENKLSLNFPTHDNALDHAEAHTLASHTTKTHDELTDVTTSQHHVRYADTEAVAAVEDEPSLDLIGDVDVGGVLTIKEGGGTNTVVQVDSAGDGTDPRIDFRGFTTPTTEVFRMYLDDSTLTAYLNIFPALTGGLKLRVNSIDALAIGTDAIIKNLRDSAGFVTGAGSDSRFYFDGGRTYVLDTGGDLQLKTTIDDIILDAFDDIFFYTNNGVLALTIDSSQNATFAGDLSAANLTAANLRVDYPIAEKFRVGAGATETVYNNFPTVKMPIADNNCTFNCSLRIPSSWVGTTGNLKIRYMVSLAYQSYSVKWTVVTGGIGESVVTNLNASTSYDFGGQMFVNQIFEKTIPLTALAAEDMLGILCASDASNGCDLHIVSIHLEP